MKRSIAFGVCAASINFHASAQTGEKIQWVKAMVVTDGGSVYSEPDFDAKVADYLSVKTPLSASRTAVPGKGGLGLFHRVRYQNKLGFMADVDIKILEASESAAPADMRPNTGGERKRRRIKSKAYANEESGGEGRSKSEPMYFTRSLGASLTRTNFTEKFEDHTMRSMMVGYGLRMTGPGVLFDGPPIDFNFLFSLQKPGYYSNFTKDVTGFMMFGDLDLMVPIAERDDWLITVAMGPMWVYTNYKVQISNSKFDSQELRVGVDFGLGGGFRFGPRHHKIYSIRGDAKYYFERYRYYGHMLSFQVEF